MSLDVRGRDTEGEVAVARDQRVEGVARAGVPVDDRPPHAEAIEHCHHIVLGAFGVQVDDFILRGGGLEKVREDRALSWVVRRILVQR